MMIEGIDLTLGVEEEYQIINPATGDLDSYVRQLLESGGQFTAHSSLQPELMQSQIEAARFRTSRRMRMISERTSCTSEQTELPASI